MTIKTTVTPHKISRCIQNLRAFHETYLQHLKFLQDLMLSADHIMQGDDFRMHIEVCADYICELERHPSLFEHTEHEVDTHISRGITVYQTPAERKASKPVETEVDYDDIPF